jgi:hypothetical protein
MADESNIERLEELFIAQTLFGLNPDEEVELQELWANLKVDLGSLARVICALDVMALEGHDVELPKHIRERIRDRATSEVIGAATPTRTVSQSIWKNPLLPWALAIAASLALIGTLVTSALNTPSQIAPLSPSQRRNQLVANATDLVSKSWSEGPTGIPGAGGDIVWSPSKQLGFMRFRGMTVNNPTNEQYQLWIFDRNQDEKTPIDGGVFDIASNDEVVIEFQPKIKAQDVYLFAVTIEKPGGVVVSDRSRLPLLSSIP